MKSALLSAFVLISASLFFASCNKEYSCICTSTSLNDVNESKVLGTRKSDAASACDYREVTTFAGKDYDCVLK
jgi:hypothetical protein